jgi:hypothetical protein
VAARSVNDLPETQRQLATLLRGAQHVRPERLAQLATAIARCCQTTAGTIALRDPAWAPVRQALGEHARLLHGATARTGRIVSVSPGDLLPVRQAAEALQGLRRYGPPNPRGGSLLADYVDGLAEATHALDQAVTRAVTTGRWLAPDSTTDLMEPVWAPIRPKAPMPTTVRAVRSASRHADVLHDLVGSAEPLRTTQNTPALSMPAVAGSLLVQRPRWPSQPVFPRPVPVPSHPAAGRGR